MSLQVNLVGLPASFRKEEAGNPTGKVYLFAGLGLPAEDEQTIDGEEGQTYQANQVDLPAAAIRVTTLACIR